MSVTRKNLPQQSSIRWDQDLQPLVALWFKKNPGWTISQLANQAIRKFVVAAHATEPIEIESLDSKLREKLIAKIMSEHADALERLK